MDFQVLTRDSLSDLLTYHGVMWCDERETINEYFTAVLENNPFIHVNYSYCFLCQRPDGSEFETNPPDDDKWKNQRLDRSMPDPGYMLDFVDVDCQPELFQLEMSNLNVFGEPVGTWLRWKATQPPTGHYEEELIDDGDDNQDDEYVKTVRKVALGSVEFAFVMYYAIRNLTKPGKQAMRASWVDYHFTQAGRKTNVNHSTLVEWFLQNQDFFPKIRFVFYTSLGTVFYQRLVPEEKRVCHIQYDCTARMWRYVYNLRSFFHLRKDRSALCELCNRWHGMVRKCPWSVNDLCTPGPKAKKTMPFYYEEQRQHAVVYADTEVFLESVGGLKFHRFAAIGAFCPNGSDEKYFSITREDSISAVGDFLDQISDEFLPNREEVEEINEVWYHCKCGKSTEFTKIGISMMTGKLARSCYQCWDRFHSRILIYFHNNARYDSHIILKEIYEWVEEPEVQSEIKDTVLSKGVTQWESFAVPTKIKGYYFTFKDTFKMLASSLRGLGQDFVKSKQEPRYLDSLEEVGKGFFPYTWFDTFEKVDEKELPEVNHWENKEEYREAVKVWNENGFETFGDYLRHYLKFDIMVMAEVFESFRDLCLEEYRHDPFFFHGAPSFFYHYAKYLCTKEGSYERKFSWTNLDMQKYYWDNIRGGICQASKPLWEREKTKSEMNPEGGSAVMVDVAGMYASCMRGKFPIGNTMIDVDVEDKMAWLTENLEEACKEESNKSFHAEVEWGYDKSLHDEHYQVPLVEKRHTNGGLINSFEEFRPQLHSAQRILQLLHQGLEIKKIVRIIEFEQDYVFREYVDKNLKLRLEAKERGNKALDTVAKLANNSAYGKTMERVSKYRQIGEMLDEIPDVPYWSSMTHENETVRYFYPTSTEVKSKKTPHMGFTILERSKELIYGTIIDLWNEFNHDVFDKVEIAYCDTDSLLVSSDTIPNLWQEMKTRLPERFVEDKILGKWENEAKETGEIEGYVCLASKQYCIKGEKITKVRHKGVPSKMFKPTFEDYKRTLITQNDKKAKLEIWERRNGLVSTRVGSKRALSIQNNKRIRLDNSVTLPYGYDGEKFKTWKCLRHTFCE